jgi:hypothetical protein
LKTDVSPLYLTYFMLDWDKVQQSPCDQKCAECGGAMSKTEPVVDSKGLEYEGYVCHLDKRVVWLRR